MDGYDFEGSAGFCMEVFCAFEVVGEGGVVGGFFVFFLADDDGGGVGEACEIVDMSVGVIAFEAVFEP